MAQVPGGSLDPYKFEVFMQCHAATQAWNRAFVKLSVNSPPDPVGGMTWGLLALGDLQAFLVAAGILSDLFPRFQPSRCVPRASSL